MLLTRSPLGLPQCCHWLDPVRLACIRHAASVRPEPGSNSPSRSRGNQPELVNPSIGEPGHHGKPASAGLAPWTANVNRRPFDGALIENDCPDSVTAVARTRFFVLSSVFKERAAPLDGVVLWALAPVGASVPASRNGRGPFEAESQPIGLSAGVSTSNQDYFLDIPLSGASSESQEPTWPVTRTP